jgi:divalent metal cation (Fe/Co/Zn/Cd) transporter
MVTAELKALSADKVIQEYKELAATFVRQFEVERARGNAKRLGELSAIADDDLLRNWLWKFTILGALLCFVVLPVLLSFVAALISVIIMEVVWLLLKAAMAVVLIAACFAIYLTVSGSQQKD